MEKLYRSKQLGRFLSVVVATLVLSGCSQKGINDNTTPQIALHMKVTEPALIESVTQFLLIVSGPGMDSIRTDLVLSGGRLEGEVDVPAGRKRKFEVRAFDESGQLIYLGSTVVDIEPGENIKLTINLYPRVPLVKLSPRFQEAAPKSHCTVDVKAFRIWDLYGISFIIHYDGLLVYPDSASLASELGPNVIMLPPQNDSDLYSYATGITQTDQKTPIVDRNGNATLARIFFTTDPELSGPAQLTVQVTGLTKIVNSTPIEVPIDGIYTDGSLIEVGCDLAVTFPDPLLEDAVRQTILKLQGDICLSEVLTIDTLYADGAAGVPGISNLTGLSHLVNLKFLELDLNQISDITELAPLTNLEMLFLAYNDRIRNIAPLSGLLNLRVLDLRGNDITDIHPLIQNAMGGGIGAEVGDQVYLTGNPLADTAQVDTLCAFGPAVFLEPDVNWCERFLTGQGP